MTTTIELRNAKGAGQGLGAGAGSTRRLAALRRDTGQGAAGEGAWRGWRARRQVLVSPFADPPAPSTVTVTGRRDAEPRTRLEPQAPCARCARRCAPGPQPTELMPDRRHRARHRPRGDAGRDAPTSRRRARIYDWVVANTYREPKVRGCGVGDIKAMLETGNMGGKCADINALFVGLCRPSAFRRATSTASAWCRRRSATRSSARQPGQPQGRAALPRRGAPDGHGWVAMDPADVAKVMRLETPEWIKDPSTRWSRR